VSQRNPKSSIGLSFDVECYYQIVRKDYLGESTKPTSEVLENTNWILDELKLRDIRATFYFLGNVAEHYPELVVRAVQDGHEIGVHGDNHEYINKLTQEEFRNEISSAIAKLRRAGAVKITGHRAPAFSIGRSNLWALDVLRDAGLEYDSSIMPLAGKRYGIADWPKQPTMTDHGINEVPMSVVNILGRTMACMGGGYVRYFPFAYTKFCASRLHAEGRTPVCYFHPYEFEERGVEMSADDMQGVDQSVQKRLNRMNTMQSYGRGRAMRKKLRMLMENYEVRTVGSLQATRGSL
jgi:polysaccharide deacetylase family protein (PEP-CTERM system associated)